MTLDALLPSTPLRQEGAARYGASYAHGLAPARRVRQIWRVPADDDDARVPADTPEARPPATPGGSRAVVIGHGVAWTARWSGRWLLVAGALVVAGLVVRVAWTIILPVALALVLASVLAPVAGFLRRRLRLPAALAAALTMVGFVVVVAGVLAAVAPSFAEQSGSIVSSASDGLQRVQDWVQSQQFLTQDQVDEALQTVQDRIQESPDQIVSGVVGTVSIAGSIVISTVVTLIVTFLLLKDGTRFLPWLREVAGPGVGDHLVLVGERAWEVLGGFVRTQALVSLIDAVLIGAGLLVVGVPLAVPLAVLTFAGGFIPIVGAFVAGALAVLVALVSNGVGGAVAILVVVVLVQQLEGNVLSPWLQSRSMRLHPAVVLLSVTLAGTLFGITGAFLAVPVAAVGAVVLRYWGELAELRAVSPEPPEAATEDDVPTPGAEETGGAAED